MKVTGIAIFCLGVAIGLFGVFLLATLEEEALRPTLGHQGFALLLSFTTSAAALVFGGLLWAYGGSGTIETRNPAVRN